MGEGAATCAPTVIRGPVVNVELRLCTVPADLIQLQPRDDSEITPMCLVIVLVILSFILISSFIFNFSGRRKAILYTGSKGNIALSSAASSIGSKFFF